jgi:hypothetical protein
MANCPACGKPAAAGVSKCASCGKPIPAAVDYGEIDLMPEEAPKATAYNAYEEPTALAPGEVPGKKKKRDRTKDGIALPPAPVIPEDPAIKKDNLKFAAIAAATVLVLAGLVTLKMCRVENKITPPAPFEQTFAVLPDKPKVQNYEVSGTVAYKFEITALDGDVLAGVAQRAPTDPATPAALKALPDSLAPVRKGESSPTSGELKNGKYSWIVVAEGKKSVRVKVKFSAK